MCFLCCYECRKRALFEDHRLSKQTTIFTVTGYTSTIDGSGKHDCKSHHDQVLNREGAFII